jgi:hypothetical protein
VDFPPPLVGGGDRAVHRVSSRNINKHKQTIKHCFPNFNCRMIRKVMNCFSSEAPHSERVSSGEVVTTSFSGQALQVNPLDKNRLCRLILSIKNFSSSKSCQLYNWIGLAPGWPDWSNFRPFGDCLHWPMFVNSATIIQIWATFVNVKSFVSVLTKETGWATCWTTVSQTHLVALILA